MWTFNAAERSAASTQRDAGPNRAMPVPAGWRRSFGRRFAKACALVALATAVCLPPSSLAHEASGIDSGGTSLQDASTPWAITSLPYVTDPAYNNGRISPDAFAGSSSNDYYGRKIVQVDDGTVIVAGVVPPISGGSNPVNLGLVRYLPSGQRVAWTNPGVYGHNGNQYVTYPNINTSAGNDGNVLDVRDMKVLGSRLFVLVNHRWGPNDVDAAVLVFNLSGQFLARTAVSASFDNNLAGGIVVYSNLQFPETISIGYAGYTDVAGVSRPEFSHGTVNADGTITFNGIVQPNPGNYCPADRGCMLTSISGGLSTGGTRRFYVAGTRYNTGAADTDFLVMALNASGTPLAGFAETGVTTVPFNRGGALSDSVNKVISTRGFPSSDDDSIYLVGDVAQACKTGVGIVKLWGDGAFDNTFGDPQVGGTRSGKRLIGGLNTTCPTIGSSANYSYDAALDGSHLGIASTSISPNNTIVCGGGQPCPEDNLNGAVIVLDSVTGDTESFASYPYTDTVGGPRTRHSAFIGIAAGGSGSFALAGNTRYFQAAAGAPAGKNQYASLRVRPVDDVIFRHGFDSN